MSDQIDDIIKTISLQVEVGIKHSDQKASRFSLTSIQIQWNVCVHLNFFLKYGMIVLSQK